MPTTAPPAHSSPPAAAVSLPSADVSSALPAAPLPPSALALLEQLELGKYRKRFLREDLTETAMFTAMLVRARVSLEASLEALGP